MFRVLLARHHDDYDLFADRRLEVLSMVEHFSDPEVIWAISAFGLRVFFDTELQGDCCSVYLVFEDEDDAILYRLKFGGDIEDYTTHWELLQ